MDLSKLNWAVPKSLIDELNIWAAEFGLNSNIRLAHFLAQLDHESGSFKRTEENLNYSEKRLSVVFPKYFNESNTLYYAKKPAKIANRVYSSRMGNGNEASGDGFAFRGRGYIQLTGKSNYEAFGKTIKEDLVKFPDLVKTKYSTTSALWFFNSNKLWSICDQGTDRATVIKLTKRINGGTIGLEDRIAKLNKYIKILEIV